MKRISALILVSLLISIGSAQAATINVNAAGGGDYTTIQAAITAAASGDVILVAAGTYTQTGQLNISKPVTITGADRATVIVNCASLATSYGVSIYASDVTLENMTIVPLASGYPLHASGSASLPGGLSNLTLRNLSVTGYHRRAGIDILGYSNVVLSNLTSCDAWGGNGVQITACVGVAADHITTSGNAWGSMAIYCNATMARGSSNVVIDGATLSAGENNVFAQDEFGYVNSNYSVTGYPYIVRNSSAVGYTFMCRNLADATTRALSFTGFTASSTIANLASGGYDVAAGMSIQTAINAASSGSVVRVGPGSYVEAISITKPLTVAGATAGVSKNGYTVPAGYAWNTAVESVITHPTPAAGYNAIVDIVDADNVTFDGFVVGELSAIGNLNTSLVRVYALTRAITNVQVINCVVGPNTNVASQDGTKGRMGLYLVNHPYGANGIMNSTIAHNKFFDAKGNGDNIFIWSSYYAYGAASPAPMTGTVITDNEIYGSHRCGIESAGGFTNLTISDNVIRNNNALPTDAANGLKYGHGILLVRGASDKIAGPATAYGPVNLSITGNQIYGNSKTGVYMDVKNTGVSLTDNVIHGNGWNGVMVDLVGNYWNPTFESPPTSGQYACYDCSSDVSASGNEIYDNGTAGNLLADYGVAVNGTPTNGFAVDARSNWWGAASGPYHATLNAAGTGSAVTDHVLFSPWSGQAGIAMAPSSAGPLTCGQPVALTVKFTADASTPDLFLYDVTVAIPAGLTYVGSADAHPFGGSNAFFYDTDNGDGTRTFTGTTVSSPSHPVSGPGTFDLFTLNLQTAASGTSDVTITSVTLRDPANVDIPASATGASISVDCDAPAAVTAVTATTGHNKIAVAWNHSGSDVDHYEVYAGLWHDGSHASAYPEYDDLAADVIPSRPATRAAASASADWALVGSPTAKSSLQAWADDLHRGVYYYEVFAIDAAGNASPAASAGDRATNYWLGDVGLPFDGMVAVGDISRLGATFGLAGAAGAYDNACDVGPTDDHSGLGIPSTDSKINFEDLMIFALNFGVASPAKALDYDHTPPVLAWTRVGDGAWALQLDTPCAALKGLHLTGAVDGQIVAVPGALLADQTTPVMFELGEGLDINLAVMGSNLGMSGSGELLRVEGISDISSIVVDARGLDNAELKAEISVGNPLPGAFAVRPNYPNPFNPQTTISFDLSRTGPVLVEVFDLGGRSIRTLLNETRAAGSHTVIWNGMDDAGQPAASGTYLYRVRTDGRELTRKMMLMK